MGRGPERSGLRGHREKFDIICKCQGKPLRILNEDWNCISYLFLYFLLHLKKSLWLLGTLVESKLHWGKSPSNFLADLFPFRASISLSIKEGGWERGS